jgi:hypothetical protein
MPTRDLLGARNSNTGNSGGDGDGTGAVNRPRFGRKLSAYMASTTPTAVVLKSRWSGRLGW